MRRHEKPLRRTNPSGKVVWCARWTDRRGKRRYGWPPDIPGTFALQRQAQDAIDACYDRDATGGGPANADTVGGYAATWLRRHPRAERTELAYEGRLKIVADIRLDRAPFRDWRLADVRRREVNDILTVLLDSGRSAHGAKAILHTLSAMWEDAICDDRAMSNPFRGLRLRQNDPRVKKAPRPVRVYSWEQMHAFAAAAPGPYGEAMIRVLSDCGLRIGEMLPLERGDIDGDWLWVRRTAYNGRVEAGTKTTRGAAQEGRRTPLAPGLRDMLLGLPPRIDTRRLFPPVRGPVWHAQRFYPDVWAPARKATGLLDARPHEFRHSFVSLMRAAGVDPAHLADWTGHTVLTATTTYTHAVGDVSDMARALVASGSRAG